METDYQDYATSSDYCIHGTYLGSWAGPDYMCGACESGADYAISHPAWDVKTTMVKLGTGEILSEHYRGKGYITEDDARNLMRETAQYWAALAQKNGGPMVGIEVEEDDNLVQVDLPAYDDGTIRMTVLIEQYQGGGWVDERTLREMRDEGRDFTVTYPEDFEFDEDEG